MTVVVPAGLPLQDAARWVGASCWLELYVHEVITHVLALEVLHDDQRAALWRVRANRAEAAEAWHRRLPELREFPRSSFVVAPDGDDGAEPSAEDVAAGGIPVVAAWLTRLHRRYQVHAAVAVGPADGPVAATLSWARSVLVPDLEAMAIGAVPPNGPSVAR